MSFFLFFEILNKHLIRKLEKKIKFFSPLFSKQQKNCMFAFLE